MNILMRHLHLPMPVTPVYWEDVSPCYFDIPSLKSNSSEACVGQFETWTLTGLSTDFWTEFWTQLFMRIVAKDHMASSKHVPK